MEGRQQIDATKVTSIHLAAAPTPMNTPTPTPTNTPMPTNTPTPTPLSTAYTVTVTGGSGSGNYREGETVTVVMDPPPEGMRLKSVNHTAGVPFTRITGTEQVTYTFVMPAFPVTVRAVYEELSAAPTPTPTSVPVADTARIVVEDMTVRKGSSVDVGAYILNNPGIAGAALAISYDQSALALTSVTVSEDDLFYAGSRNIYQGGNVVHVQWYHTENVTTDGTLFTLQFDVDPAAQSGNYSVSIGLVDDLPDNLCNWEFENVVVEFVPGTLTVI